jgi:DNA-directed RNA polymerase specialized sigma24 family protein
MALDPAMDARLRRWAEELSVGSGAGYPAMSVLHPNWQPPPPGQAPTMKAVSSSDVAETRRALRSMPEKLMEVVIVYYRWRLDLQDKALMLQCQPGTVIVRLGRAHAWLRAWLAGEQ